MQKNMVFILCGCFLSFELYSQSSGIESVLQEIEQNNKELIALATFIESKEFELKSGNNLPDPQLGAYFLPFGDHGTGSYSEFQISQSFEFPTVYGARSNLISQQSVQLELDFKAKRQEILLAAHQYCIELAYLNKRMIIERKRVEQAKMIFDQVQELFEQDQVGTLELNKAKVVWMQEQFKILQIESDEHNILLLLQNLNGGNAISFEQIDYLSGLDLDDKDSLWKNKLADDPLLKQLKQQQTIAELQLKLSLNESFPNITAGYNYQGISMSNYSGIYAGISIPIWSNRNKVKASQSYLQYQESFATSRTLQLYSSFGKQFNDYQVLLDKFTDYQLTLDGLNSDQLLLQAYQLGEISFIEYYMELQFYRQAFDTMLDIERQLHQVQADILKHQL